MEALLALLIGALVAASVYLMLSRHVVRFLFGLVLFSNAVNVLLLTAGRVRWGAPPLVPEGLEVPLEAVANPLPQALILTAIVIGFGLLAFALVLSVRGVDALGTADLDAMRAAEPRADAAAKEPR
ncbi:Na+/H+ antiporter subunit C [Myxococcota bacterium]|nr:Na+/H+ antiporter subunit C [Myxococcota bacterium]MCZ7616956.1 Na+/H+ antiporter subunit C [Myxococcota bacterium]